MTDRIHNKFAPAATPPSHAALIVDVQMMTMRNMELADTRAYLKALGEFIESRRAANVPVIWVSLHGRDSVHAPKHGDNTRRSLHELIGQGFIREDAPKTPVEHELVAFFLNHGPRKNETVRVKMGVDAFEGFVGVEFEEHLKERKIESLTIAGAVAFCCVAHSDNGAKKAGFHSAIRSDLCLSWANEDSWQISQRKLFWGGTPAHTAEHERNIRQTAPDARLIMEKYRDPAKVKHDFIV